MGRWLSDLMAGVPPALAYLVVGILATAESLFLGLVLPGELVSVLGGTTSVRLGESRRVVCRTWRCRRRRTGRGG
jgi:membrane protein DedA with SNARE-associated domain